MTNLKRIMLAAGAALIGAAGIARAEDAAKATDEHKAMAKAVGVWEAEVKVWTKGPDAPPEVSKGVEEVTLMPGGLWLVSKFDGEMSGSPFTGRGLSGYDPAKKKYVDVWVDSSDPHMMILEGEYDPASKTLTSFGKSTDPKSGKAYDVKTETLLKGDDEREFTFYFKTEETGGSYLKILQMTYHRKSK